MGHTPFVITAGILQFGALIVAACWGIASEQEERSLAVACAMASLAMSAGAFAVLLWGVGR